MSGHKMSGFKMSGHKMLGLNMLGNKMSGHKMSDRECPGSITGGQGGWRSPGGRYRVPWVYNRGPRGQDVTRRQIESALGQ